MVKLWRERDVRSKYRKPVSYFQLAQYDLLLINHEFFVADFKRADSHRERDATVARFAPQLTAQQEFMLCHQSSSFKTPSHILPKSNSSLGHISKLTLRVSLVVPFCKIRLLCKVLVNKALTSILARP